MWTNLSSALGKVPYKIIYPAVKGLKAFFKFAPEDNKEIEFIGRGSATFDGTGDYIEIEHDLGIDTGYGTVMFWVYRPTKAEVQYYFDFRGTDGDNSPAGTGLAYSYNNGNSIYISPTTSSPINPIKYENGEIVSTNKSYEDKWTHIAFTNLDLKMDAEGGNIGARYDNGNNINGKMKNFAIWERALTQSEVKSVMNKTYEELTDTEKQGLKAWYPFETDANNAHSSSYHAAAVNDTSFDNSIYGGNTPIKKRAFDNADEVESNLIGNTSFVFNRANDDYIYFADADNLSQSNHTLSFWVKFDDTTNTTGIITKYDHTVTAQREFRVWQSSGHVKYSIYNSTDQSEKQANTSYTFTAGVWTHYAFTHDGSNLKGYVDGVLRVTTSTGGDDATVNSASAPLIFGSWWDDGAIQTGGQDFDGSLAQISWWSTALTEDQIKTIKEKAYSDLTVSEKENLVSWWGDETVGISGTDYVTDSHGSTTGAGNTGTLY